MATSEENPETPTTTQRESIKDDSAENDELKQSSQAEMKSKTYDPPTLPLLTRLCQHLPEDQQKYLANYPLHAACSIGCVKEVEAHLSRVDQVDSYGNFPLYLAVKQKDPEIVEMLLSAGADVETCGSSKTCTPLHLALKIGATSAVRILLEFGADAEATDKKGDKAIHHAVAMAQVDCVKQLLRYGANPNAPAGTSLETPLQMACNLLNENQTSQPRPASPSSTPLPLPVSSSPFPSYSPALSSSSSSSSVVPTAELVRALVMDGRTELTAVNADGNTALHQAVENGNLEAAQTLLLAVMERENGKDQASSSSSSSFSSSSRHSHPENIPKLPAPPTPTPAPPAPSPQAHCPLHPVLEARLANGRTPLHVACALNRTRFVELLTSFGADAAAEDLHRNTPLHIAARMENTEILHTLLNAGADVTKADHEGATPIHVAVSEAKDIGVLHTFLIYGVDPNIKESETQMTPLHLAIEVGNWEAIEALLQGGADVNTLTADQRSPLHLAVVACHKEICKRFVTDRLHRYSVCTSGLHPTIAGILLAYDAYIDHQDAQGFTPLHLACRYGLVDMAQVLINAGANLTLQDGMGYDPFMSCRLVSSEDRKALYNLIFRAGYVPTPERRDRLKGSALASLIRNFDEHNVQLVVQCGYRISADKWWKTELGAAIYQAENPPIEQPLGADGEEVETPRLTSAEELESLYRIRIFLEEFASSTPPSLWLLSRAAIRSHILAALQVTDGNHGERGTIWARVDGLPVPEPIRAWLKLDPTRYNDPE